jgi:S-DNA-T family DNA segregation ATPase FtsK/SpoIIIE
MAAARADGVRRAFGDWLGAVRSSRHGLLLGPGAELDADLLGVVLPRAARRMPAPGAAWLVADGVAEPVRLALDEPAT